ncbi:hypothetical protein MASR1M90_11130 [Desulfovibrionales bacterium]
MSWCCGSWLQVNASQRTGELQDLAVRALDGYDMAWVKLFGKMAFQLRLDIMLGNGSSNADNGKGRRNFKAIRILFHNLTADHAAESLD